MERFTRTELQSLLRHPDGEVRSLADWTREYRGWGWRTLNGRTLTSPHAAEAYELKLRERLATLAAA